MKIRVFIVLLLLSLFLNGRGYRQENFRLESGSYGNGDTFITNQSPDSNFSDDRYLIVGVKDNFQYWGLFFFSVPLYEKRPVVTEARLLLTPVFHKDSGPFKVYHINNRFFPSREFFMDNAINRAVTWNTMPVFGPEPIGHTAGIKNVEDRIGIDITEALQISFDNKKDFCGILLRMSMDFSTSHNSYAVFYSSRNQHYSYKSAIPVLKYSLKGTD